jgi:hypothetical protein
VRVAVRDLVFVLQSDRHEFIASAMNVCEWFSFLN